MVNIGLARCVNDLVRETSLARYTHVMSRNAAIRWITSLLFITGPRAGVVMFLCIPYANVCYTLLMDYTHGYIKMSRPRTHDL